MALYYANATIFIQFFIKCNIQKTNFTGGVMQLLVK